MTRSAVSREAERGAVQSHPRGWRLLRVIIAALIGVMGLSHGALAGGDTIFGSYGPEGPRLREQLWILPGGDPQTRLRATVFRPADGQAAEAAPRRPLVVINHGTSDATRLAVAMPVYYWLSRWFVERGYVVVLPQRRGHGATGGALAESIGSCADPDHFHSGLAAADDIEAVVDFMTGQSFVEPGGTIVVGISSGGWASLALASRSPANVQAVINFAGGRGGRAMGMPGREVCGEQRLLDAARAYGATAKLPTLWLYAANDSYFRPQLARALATGWNEAGGAADLRVFPPYGTDGHNLADDRAGWDIWGPVVDEFLTSTRRPPVAALGPDAPRTDKAVVPQSIAATGTGSGEMQDH